MIYGINYSMGDKFFNRETQEGMFKEDALKELKGIVKKEADNIGEPVEYQLYEVDGKKRTTYPPEIMKPRCIKLKEDNQIELENKELKDEITRLQSEWEGFKGKYKKLEDEYAESVEEILKLKDLLNTKQTIIENLQQEYNFIENEMEKLLEENKKMSKDLAYVAVEAIRLMGDIRYGKKD